MPRLLNTPDQKTAQNLTTMQQQSIPNPPASLSEQAATLWERYTDELHGRKMLHDCDLAALERLCRLEVQADALLSQIEREGAIVADRDGTQRRNPALMALQNISGIVEGLKRSLAIGAYYRHRIGEQPQEEKPKSPLMALMNKPRTPYRPPNEDEGKKNAM